ncbi:MAG: xylulose kinase [Desulfobacteraceae bacterium]|nr:xylulose kinase [Desulfobacteraceae bacterium]
MAGKKLLAGIDAGTTGVTVMIADTDGNIIGSAYREYPCAFPHPGWVEQDMELMWTRLCEASNEVIASTGVNPEEIASLGFSSQRGTFVCVDKDMTPLADSIVWSCGRAGEEFNWINDNLGGDRYHDISGVPLSGLWSYAKMKWVVDKRPDLLEKTHLIVNGQEFFLHKFGADDISSDPASITLNGMMDIATLDWSKELCDLIGLPMEKLPPMKTPARQVGVVSKEASEASGFAKGMPICFGGGDQQCAAIGAGVIREGLAEITIGTASVMVAHIDSRKPDPEHLVLMGGSAIPNKWDMEGLAFATGVCLRWWRDTYAQVERHTAQELEMDSYDIISAQAASAPVGCKGYIFFPFFSGQVTPHYVDNARGGAIGLSLIHDRAMMARSIMEGGAYELRMIVDAMEAVLGKPFESIRLSGGGAKSPLWNQIQADVYGRPVERLEVSECTTLGATILGAAGAGVFGSVEEAVTHMVHPFGSIEPDMKNHAIYQDVFGVFRDTFLALRDADIYDKIAAVQSKHWG